jgi:hypothetical protein
MVQQFAIEPLRELSVFAEDPRINSCLLSPILLTLSPAPALNSNVRVFSLCDWHLPPCFLGWCSCLEVD